MRYYSFWLVLVRPEAVVEVFGCTSVGLHWQGTSVSAAPRNKWVPVGRVVCTSTVPCAQGAHSGASLGNPWQGGTDHSTWVADTPLLLGPLGLRVEGPRDTRGVGSWWHRYGARQGERWAGTQGIQLGMGMGTGG